MQPKFVQATLDLAREKMLLGEGGPFAALVVLQGAVVARGWNRVTIAKDPTAHAEIEAIRNACRALDQFQLKGCVLYSSCEPCPMCWAAIHWARLDAVHFAGTRHDAAMAGFDDERLYRELSQAAPARQLPMTQAPEPYPQRARELFDTWVRWPGKRAY